MRANLRSEFSLIPILFSIAIFVFVVDQVYIWTNEDIGLINAFSAAMAIGSILMGLLSDAFSRRVMILLVHGLSAIFLAIYYFNPTSYLYIFLLGIVYSPLAIARATLIDNISSYSKIKLISLSFLVQFIPETLYFLYLKIPKYDSFLYAISAIFLSFVLGLIFFFDRRDERIRKENVFSKIAEFVPSIKPKALFTFIAFIPTQIAYFVSDNLLEVYSLSPLYYSILSFGSVVGACVSILYKKTPHIATLTITYGLCFVISCLPVVAIYLYNYPKLDIPFMFIVLGSLLGFYVPFVYDIILHAVEKNFRGTACGLLDFVYSGSSLITLIMFKALLHNIELSLILVAIAFILAVGFQRASEKIS